MARWNNPASSPAYKDVGRPPTADLARPDDLYARWAIATQWRGFARGGLPCVNGHGQRLARAGEVHGPAGTSDFDVRVIARASDQAALDNALSELSWLKIPDLYRARIPGRRGQRPLYFTATLKRADLTRLFDNQFGIEWELAMPLHEAKPVTQATTAGRYGPLREESCLAAPALPAADPGLRKPIKPGSIGDAIAVIDFGCPFLNERFAGERGCRVVALWDQSERHVDFAQSWWSDPTSSAGYGRELAGEAIREMVERARGLVPPVDETTIYRGLDHLIAYEDPRRRLWYATHGGHVMDLAAGTVDPLAALCGGTAKDKASKANIVFVQLPSLTAADSSGGSLSAHLLDGVRYAMHVCKPDATLVINISYGSFAGPHDGSSLIERAFDDLLERRPRNFAIVLAAGNARQANCHVKRTVSMDKSALLRFAITPADTTDTFLELWYPGRSLRVRVRTADRDWSPWVAPGGEALLTDEATQEPLALLQHQYLPAVQGGTAQPDDEQGKKVPTKKRGTEAVQLPPKIKTMVLLALAPTAPATDDVGPFNQPGLWEMEIALAEGQQDETTFDAWIERDDPGDRDVTGSAAQPCFLGMDIDDERNTLSSIATGQHTVVVAGYRWRDGMAAAYSSLPEDGFSLNRKSSPAASSKAQPPLPLLLAPCEEDAWQPTLQAAAVRSTETHRMNGTSVAAPIVARRLYNLLVGARGASVADKIPDLLGAARKVVKLARS